MEIGQKQFEEAEAPTSNGFGIRWPSVYSSNTVGEGEDKEEVSARGCWVLLDNALRPGGY